MAYHTGQDELIFFDKHPAAFPLYEVFACVSFARIKKKAELPDPYIVVTLGLSYPLESDRAAVKTEPYPGRWTTHFVINSQSELDDEFYVWVKQAFGFSGSK